MPGKVFEDNGNLIMQSRGSGTAKRLTPKPKPSVAQRVGAILDRLDDDEFDGGDEHFVLEEPEPVILGPGMSPKRDPDLSAQIEATQREHQRNKARAEAARKAKRQARARGQQEEAEIRLAQEELVEQYAVTAREAFQQAEELLERANHLAKTGADKVETGSILATASDVLSGVAAIAALLGPYGAIPGAIAGVLAKCTAVAGSIKKLEGQAERTRANQRVRTYAVDAKELAAVQASIDEKSAHEHLKLVGQGIDAVPGAVKFAANQAIKKTIQARDDARGQEMLDAWSPQRKLEGAAAKFLVADHNRILEDRRSWVQRFRAYLGKKEQSLDQGFTDLNDPKHRAAARALGLEDPV